MEFMINKITVEYNNIEIIFIQTGRSCGYGYVEFFRPEVAKIAAETMNNYLMNGRLVKGKLKHKNLIEQNFIVLQFFQQLTFHQKSNTIDTFEESK